MDIIDELRRLNRPHTVDCPRPGAWTIHIHAFAGMADTEISHPDQWTVARKRIRGDGRLCQTRDSAPCIPSGSPESEIPTHGS